MLMVRVEQLNGVPEHSADEGGIHVHPLAAQVACEELYEEQVMLSLQVPLVVGHVHPGWAAHVVEL